MKVLSASDNETGVVAAVVVVDAPAGPAVVGGAAVVLLPATVVAVVLEPTALAAVVVAAESLPPHAASRATSARIRAAKTASVATRRLLFSPFDILEILLFVNKAPEQSTPAGFQRQQAAAREVVGGAKSRRATRP